MLGTQEQGSRFSLPLMGLPPFPWGVPARVPECGAVPRNLFPKFVPKSNAGPLLLGAFADWVGNRLSLYLMEAGTDKGQDPLEIRAFRQKESTATLIHIVSKLRCFFGKSTAHGYNAPCFDDMVHCFVGSILMQRDNEDRKDKSSL